MDWEMYDLDGDEVALRPISRTLRRCRPWRSPHSAKPLPRSAGSVNRPGRCEYVMELVQFCHDHDSFLRRSEQLPFKKHLPPDVAPPRHVRSKSSRSSLHQTSSTRATKRKPIPRKQKLRTMPLHQTEKSSDSGNGNSPLGPCKSSSSQSTGQLSGLQLLPSTSGADRKNEADTECHYPGIALLPPTTASTVEDISNGQSTPLVDSCDLALEPSAEIQSAIEFVNPWTEKPISGESTSLNSTRSEINNKGHISDCSQASQTIGSDNESPTTAATSPLGSPGVGSQVFESEKTYPPLQNQSSDYIDTPCLPERSSDRQSGKGKLSSNSAGSLSPFSSHCSQEYLISCIQDSLGSRSTSTSTLTPRGQSNAPRPPGNRSPGRGTTTTNTSNVETNDTPPRNDLPRYEDRNPATRSKSWDALFPKPPQAGTSNTVHGVLSDTDLASRRRENSVPPNGLQEPPSGQAKMSRSARIFAMRMRDMAIVRTGSPANAHGGRASPADRGHRQNRSHPVSPTITREQLPRKLSAQVPLRSPRSDRPSSPPTIPLPVDPPLPPPRSSSRNRTPNSRGTTYHRKPSVEPLIEQTDAPEPTLENSASQEHKRNAQRPPSSSHQRQYAQTDDPRRESFPPQFSISPCTSVPTSPDALSPPTPIGGRASTAPGNSQTVNKQHSDTRERESTLSTNTRQKHTSPQSPTTNAPCDNVRYASPEPQSPQRLETRLAFLEQQNKMLQDALVAALGSRAGGGGGGGGTDAIRHHAELTSPGSVNFPETPAPPASRAPSAAGKRSAADSSDPFGLACPEMWKHYDEDSVPILGSY